MLFFSVFDSHRNGQVQAQTHEAKSGGAIVPGVGGEDKFGGR